MLLSSTTILNALPALDEISRERLPVRVALPIAQIRRRLKTEAESIEQVRESLVESHAMRDPAGAMVPAVDKQGEPLPGSVRVADADAFNRDLNELLSHQHDVTAPLIDPADLDALSLKPETLEALLFLFREVSPSIATAALDHADGTLARTEAMPVRVGG